MKMLDSVRSIVDNLTAQGYRAFFYGRTARSLLLRAEPLMYYILTDAGLVELAQCIESLEYPGKAGYDACCREEGLSFRFKTSGASFDGDLFDALRRSLPRQMYTVDTFVYDLKRQVFCDPWSNYEHIRRKQLFPTAHFKELYAKEPGGIFEALVLFSSSGFELSSELIEQWRELHFRMKWEEKDEIREDLSAIITSPRSYEALVMMEEHGILREIVPELAKAEKANHDKEHHPEGNVLQHTLECFRHVEKPTLELALALLLHDIGKPDTACYKRSLSFPGHSKVGARIARNQLRMIGYSEEIMDRVYFLILYHLLAHEMNRMNENDRKKLMMNPLFPDLMKLFKADILSCYGDLTHYHRILAQYNKHKRSFQQGH